MSNAIIGAVVGNIVVGRKDVDLTRPSHVPGVHEGNDPSPRRRLATREDGTAMAEPNRSTGINPIGRSPLDPRMPRLCPP